MTAADSVDIVEIIPDTLYELIYRDIKLGDIVETEEVFEDPLYDIKVVNGDGDVIFEQEGINNFKFAAFRIIKCHNLQHKRWNFVKGENNDE